MKKIIKILTMSMVSLLFFTTLNGQSLSTITFSDGNGNLPTLGMSFNVPISVENIGNVFSLTIFIDYDPSVITYNGVGVITYGPGKITVTNLTTSRLKLLLDHNTPFTAIMVNNGLLANLSFVHYGGDSPITFRTTSPNASSYLSAATFATVPITNVTNGAVNGGVVSNTISTGAWEDAAKWTLGFAPNSFHNVTIASGGTVTIDAASKANSVTIANGGRLTLNAGKTLAVVGEFTIQSGGSFLQNGTLTAAATKAERFVPAANWANVNTGWHQISSPVANQAISGVWTPTGSGNDYDFFAWDEPDDMWRNQKNAAHGINIFNVGQGYMAAYQIASTKTFSGTFNTADVALTLSKQGTGIAGDYVAGANLLGNPYPVALSWNNSWKPASVQGTAYIWNSSSYKAILDGDVIPAMNGFMVLTTVDAQGITIPATARTHNAQPWYKTTVPGIKLIANDLQTGSQQETHIKFNPQSSLDYDLTYDAFYMEGFAPQLYTKAGQSALMVNSMPILQNDTKIPLHFEKTESQNFSIQLAENSLGLVYLKDLKLNTTVKLSELMEYHFTAEAGDNPARFEVFFSPLGLGELTATHAGAYARDNTIVVYDLNGNTTIEVFSLAGQVVYATRASGSTSQFEINAGLKQGVYIVKLSDQAATNSVKVFIR